MGDNNNNGGGAAAGGGGDVDGPHLIEDDDTSETVAFKVRVSWCFGHKERDHLAWGGGTSCRVLLSRSSSFCGSHPLLFVGFLSFSLSLSLSLLQPNHPLKMEGGREFICQKRR